MVNPLPPLVCTPISTQLVVLPLKGLGPKSISVVNKPLLLTDTAVLVNGPATGLPLLTVLNNVNVMS